MTTESGQQEAAETKSDHLEPENMDPDHFESEHPQRKKRRCRKRDILMAVLLWVSIFCWGFFVAAIVFIQQASPEVQNVFSRHLELELREEWDLAAVSSALDLMYVVAGLSLVALLLKAVRHRRKRDRFPLSFTLLFLSSVIGIFYLQNISTQPKESRQVKQARQNKLIKQNMINKQNRKNRIINSGPPL
jgi:hypothetical protein